MKYLMTLALIFTSGCSVWPPYHKWEQTIYGEAELARADSNRKIKVLEAEAKKLSAVFEAEAEVERAKGVAQANKIIGASLHDNESYLRYLWVIGLNSESKEVIYVPTEANLPILEASRLKK